MAKNKEQAALFDNLDELSSWAEHWKDMPEFTQDDQMPVHQIVVSFQDRADIKKFAELLGQKCTYKTKSVWFPDRQKLRPSDYIYKNEQAESNESEIPDIHPNKESIQESENNQVL